MASLACPFGFRQVLLPLSVDWIVTWPGCDFGSWKPGCIVCRRNNSSRLFAWFLVVFFFFLFRFCVCGGGGGFAYCNFEKPPPADADVRCEPRQGWGWSNGPPSEIAVSGCHSSRSWEDWFQMDVLVVFEITIHSGFWLRGACAFAGEALYVLPYLAICVHCALDSEKDWLVA